MIFVAWTTAIDSRRPLAIARSLGATHEQVTVGLAAVPARIIARWPAAVILQAD